MAEKIHWPLLLCHLPLAVATLLSACGGSQSPDFNSAGMADNAVPAAVTERRYLYVAGTGSGNVGGFEVAIDGTLEPVPVTLPPK